MGYRATAHMGGGKAHREHNIRNPRVVAPQEHINQDGEHETWYDETELQAYKRLFSESIERYNAQQTRTDRKQSVRKYYNQVKESPKQHTSYEVIVQIGRLSQAPPPEIAKAVLYDFYKEWEENYPELPVIGAYYHADEEGVPHLHLDFIPVGGGYTTGMDKRVGLNRALYLQFGFKVHTEKQIGEDGKCRTVKVTPEQQFQNLLRERLIAIARSHGLDMEEPRRGLGEEHREMWDVKQELERAKQEANAIMESGKGKADELVEEGEKKRDELISKGQQAYDESAQMVEELKAESAGLEKKIDQQIDDMTFWTNQAKESREFAAESEKKKKDEDTLLQESLKARNEAQEATQTALKELEDTKGLVKEEKRNLANLGAIDGIKKQLLGFLQNVADKMGRAKGWKPTIYSETPEKKDFRGNVKQPKLVTIRESDLNYLISKVEMRGQLETYIESIPELKRIVSEAVDAVNLDGQLQQIRTQATLESETKQQQIDDLSVSVDKLQSDNIKKQRIIENQREIIGKYEVYDVLEERNPELMNLLRNVICAENAMRNAKNVSDPMWRQRHGKSDGRAKWHDFMSDGTSTALISWLDGKMYQPYQFVEFYKEQCKKASIPVAPDLVDYVEEQANLKELIQQQSLQSVLPSHRRR